MKFHRNLFLAVIEGLKDILLEKKQADQTVERLLMSNKSWGARDRNFIAENIYHIVRYKRLYEYCVEEEVWSEASLWRMLGAKLIVEQVVLPDWAEWSELNRDKILQRREEANAIRKVRESVPDWLDDLGVKELGATGWEKEIGALNTPAKFSVRVNTLKSNKNVISALFNTDGIVFSEVTEAPDALVLAGRKNFRTNAAYKNGLFEIQDVSSQMVAPFLEPEPGMNVIDGCAGAGGKTLHISALMQNRGEILAVDNHTGKLEELERRAKKAGCAIVKTMIASQLTTRYQQLLRGFADRILIDVPCSGTGVLRRKPDAKWSLTPVFIKELHGIQAEILDEYSVMLKPGGLLVYSTCSILPSENEAQIKAFLERSTVKFELVEERRVWPSAGGYDGFYMAKMKRVN